MMDYHKAGSEFKERRTGVANYEAAIGDNASQSGSLGQRVTALYRTLPSVSLTTSPASSPPAVALRADIQKSENFMIEPADSSPVIRHAVINIMSVQSGGQSLHQLLRRQRTVRIGLEAIRLRTG